MKKIIMLLLIFITTYSAIYAQETYFENCKYIGIDYIQAFKNIDKYNKLTTKDIDNQLLEGHGIVYNSSQYLKDEFFINTSESIKDIYNDIQKLYTINNIELLKNKYPTKKVKYQAHNMDIIINPKDDSLLEITLKIKNSNIISKILIKKQKDKIYVKNEHIKEIYNHLNNISKINDILKIASSNDINTQNFILSYDSMTDNVSNNGIFKWNIIPDFHIVKYNCNEKIFATSIPIIMNYNIYQTVTINNTDIENSYKMLLKHEKQLNNNFLPDNLNSKAKSIYAIYNSQADQITILDMPQNEEDWPQLPKKYIEFNYDTNKNMVIINYIMAYINNDQETTTMNTLVYLFIQSNKNVKIIKYEEFY